MACFVLPSFVASYPAKTAWIDLETTVSKKTSPTPLQKSKQFLSGLEAGKWEVASTTTRFGRDAGFQLQVRSEQAFTAKDQAVTLIRHFRTASAAVLACGAVLAGSCGHAFAADFLTKDQVQALVMKWEKEVVLEPDISKWTTMAENFKLHTSLGTFTREDMKEIGTYNAMIHTSNIGKTYTRDESNKLWETALDHFFWEATDVAGTADKFAFEWRHHGKWVGPFEDKQPNNKEVEVLGSGFGSLNAKGEIVDLTIHFNETDLLDQFKIAHKPLLGK